MIGATLGYLTIHSFSENWMQVRAQFLLQYSISFFQFTLKFPDGISNIVCGFYRIPEIAGVTVNISGLLKTNISIHNPLTPPSFLEKI